MQTFGRISVTLAAWWWMPAGVGDSP